jgi:hypothetical protein
MNFFFPAPAISVQITASQDTPMLGQSYSLTCGITGAANLNPSITYQWTNNNGAQMGTAEILSFSSFRLSDAGQYTCQATVGSPYLNDNITMTNTHDIRIQSKFGYILVHECRWVTVDEHVTAYLETCNLVSI